MNNNFFRILFIVQILLTIVCTSTVVSAKDELYIIGFGTTPGSDDESSLQELAVKNGGQYLRAEDTSTSTELKETLTAAFSGTVTSTSTQVRPEQTEPPMNETSSCDCLTYDPYYDEDVNCYQYGIGCSKCFEACYEGEEPLPGSGTNPPCDCMQYDLMDESMSCLESGLDCSLCYYSCQ